MKTEKLCTFLVAIGVLTVVNAEANMIGQTGQLTLNYGSPQFANGGAFLATSSTLGTFETFCLEYNEEFNPSSTYEYTYQINSGAVAGGAGWTTVNHLTLGNGQNMDNISIGTAYLYSQFRNNNTVLGITTSEQAGELQDAIWYLENEITFDQLKGGFNGANAAGAEGFVTLAASGTGTTWDDTTGDGTVFNDSNGKFGVVALNLFYDAAGTMNSQDQLAIVPEPTTVIASLALMIPLGASALRILRKKKQMI